MDHKEIRRMGAAKVPGRLDPVFQNAVIICQQASHASLGVHPFRIHAIGAPHFPLDLRQQVRRVGHLARSLRRHQTRYDIAVDTGHGIGHRDIQDAHRPARLAEQVPKFRAVDAAGTHRQGLEGIVRPVEEFVDAVLPGRLARHERRPSGGRNRREDGPQGPPRPFLHQTGKSGQVTVPGPGLDQTQWSPVHPNHNQPIRSTQGSTLTRKGAPSGFDTRDSDPGPRSPW